MFIFCFTASSDSMFFATIPTENIPIADGSIIVFDRDMINPGGHYNAAEGSYTAPRNGYYQ